MSAARQRQTNRFARTLRCSVNVEMGLEEIRAHCALDAAGHSLMKAKRIRKSATATARWIASRFFLSVLSLTQSDWVRAQPMVAEVAALAERLQSEVYRTWSARSSAVIVVMQQTAQRSE